MASSGVSSSPAAPAAASSRIARIPNTLARTVEDFAPPYSRQPAFLGDNIMVLSTWTGSDRDLFLYDITDPFNPKALTDYVKITSLSNIEGMTTDGERYIATCNSSGDLNIVDTGTRDMPIVGTVSMAQGAYGILTWDTDKNVIYAADNNSNFFSAADVSDVTSPVDLGVIYSGGRQHTLGISGDRLYVADFIADELRIYDTSDLQSISLLSTTGTWPGLSGDCLVDGDYLYLLCTGDLRVIDITNDLSPVQVGVDPQVTASPSNQRSSALVKHGDYVYSLNASSERIHTTNVSSPTSPVGSINYLGSLESVYLYKHPAAPVLYALDEGGTQPHDLHIVGAGDYSDLYSATAEAVGSVEYPSDGSDARPAASSVTWTLSQGASLENVAANDTVVTVPFVFREPRPKGTANGRAAQACLQEFQAAANFTVTGLAFKFPQQLAGPTAGIKLVITDASGNILGESTQAGLTAGEYYTLSLDTPVALTSGTEYKFGFVGDQYIYTLQTEAQGWTSSDIVVPAGGAKQWYTTSPTTDTTAYATWSTSGTDYQLWMALLTDVARWPSDLTTSVEETTTSRTLKATDAGIVVECTNAAASTVTVPPNADVAFPIGTVVSVYSAGAGGVTIAQGAGVTIRNLAALTQYEETSLRKRATDEWIQA